MTAKQLKQARAKTGLSQEAFAERMRVGIYSLRNWEQSRCSIPNAIELLIELLYERKRH